MWPSEQDAADAYRSEFSAPISAGDLGPQVPLQGPDGAPIDATLDDTFWRVARAAAAPEKGGKRAREKWAQRFHDAIADLGFLPAGRILAGAGTGRDVTLFNCFVLGKIEDDLGAIFDGVKDAALTMQQGGGIGHDFSTLRPKGARVASIGADASGPVSFMDVWDAMCRTIMSAGSRRGAMMATLRCDHPDIEAFIDAKSDPARLRNFNLSVLVTDAFLAAVREDRPWDLEVRRQGLPHAARRARCGSASCARPTTSPSRASCSSTASMRATTCNYCEEIHATNPCVTGRHWVHTSSGPAASARPHRTLPFAAALTGRSCRRATPASSAPGANTSCGWRRLKGYALRLTADHAVRRVKRFARHAMETDWCAAAS